MFRFSTQTCNILEPVLPPSDESVLLDKVVKHRISRPCGRSRLGRWPNGRHSRSAGRRQERTVARQSRAPYEACRRCNENATPADNRTKPIVKSAVTNKSIRLGTPESLLLYSSHRAAIRSSTLSRTSRSTSRWSGGHESSLPGVVAAGGGWKWSRVLCGLGWRSHRHSQA